MSRITAQHLAKAVKTLQAMSMAEKSALGDEVFQQQPTLFGIFLVQTRFGVSFEKMEFLLELLFVCFLSMRETGLRWPRITEDEMDMQADRYSGVLDFSRGLPTALAAQAYAQYVRDHAEPLLLAFVTTELTKWLTSVAPEESDKYVMLAAMNIANCIAYAEIPTPSK